ncbi:MAG: SH3 domain-containing protein [Anaerolineae bacterium]|jgi:uncharacterized protein YraI|nr:SH3 domain-containing protein [Anaerolineae bacterium]
MLNLNRSKLVFLSFVVFAVVILIVPATFAQTRVSLNSEAVNVRSGPGLQYSIRGEFNTGSGLVVTGRNNADPNSACLSTFDVRVWLRVEYQGLEGWVARCAVLVDGDLAGLPVVNASAPILTQDLYTEEALNDVQVDIGPKPTIAHVIGITRSRVNFRESPNINAGIKQTLADAQPVYVIGRSSDNRWLQIQFDGETGWVAGYLLHLPYQWDQGIAVR